MLNFLLPVFSGIVLLFFSTIFPIVFFFVLDCFEDSLSCSAGMEKEDEPLPVSARNAIKDSTFIMWNAMKRTGLLVLVFRLPH